MQYQTAFEGLPFICMPGSISVSGHSMGHDRLSGMICACHCPFYVAAGMALYVASASVSTLRFFSAAGQ